MARSATIYPAVPARPAVSERPTFWDTAGSMWTPSEGWLAVALLLATNLVVVVAVQRSDWVEAMPKLWLVAPIGFAAGMALGKVRGNILYQILLHLLVLGLGLVLSLWQTTELVTQPTIAVRFDEVLSRLREWASTWNSSGSISNDRLPFATMLTAGTFLMAYVSAFALFKRRWTWIAIVIPAWGLLTNQTYLPSSRYPVPITLFMLFSVALLARMHYVSGMQRWNAQGMAKRLTPGSFLFNAVALTAIVFGIGWAMPTGHWTVGVLHDGYQAARQPWQDMEGQWERVFAGVPSKRASPLHNFGSALPLRGNVALGSDSVMTVTTDFPTYWRGQTYDVYQGQGWITSSAQRTTRKGQDVYSPSDSTGYKKRVAVAQKVTLHRESNVIFAAGEPLDVNVASQVEIAQPKTYDIDLRDGSSKTPLPADLAQAAQRLVSARGSTAEMQKTLPPDTKIVREKGSTLTLTRTGPDSPDILSVKSSKSLKAESTYQVVSSVSIATDDDLHSDNATYQKWLADSYLQLPDGLPPRVKDLARTITANIRNPYDRAIAIDTYLRGYTETYNIAAPPLNADAVDYFLFIQKAGNSDYFASAMVVLLRAAGVPARVASGYALGEFDQETSSFNVKLSDAHSWPEVYFPSYGWVIFEPSPSYKPIPRGLPLPLAPNEENASGSSGGGISDEELFDLLNVPPPTTDQFVLPKPDDSVAHLFISILTKIALAIGALIGLLATIYAIVFLIWQSNFLGLSYEAGVYERMTRLGRLAWAGPNPQQTPNEYASALARATQLRHGEVAAVADGYAKARYGKGLSPGDRERVEQSWRKVRSALIKRTFWRMNPVNVVRRGE